jgi:signal recognition particle receptor subunit beta
MWSLSFSGYGSAGVILFVESRKKPKKRSEQDYITQFLHTTFHLDEAAMQFQMFVLVHVHLAYEQPSSVQQL